MLPRFITPLEQAALAWPNAVRIEEVGPPRLSLITRGITRTGTIAVSGVSFDAHTVRVEIVTGGEPGTATWRYRTDGATWSLEQLTDTADVALLSTAPDAGEITEGIPTGLRVSFAAGTPTPSFATGDYISFTTLPCQKVVAAILAASARAKALISGPDGGGQFTGDLSALDPGVKRDVALLGRVALLEDRGIDPRSDDAQLYIAAAKDAEERLIEVGNKLRFPQVTEAGPPREAPQGNVGADYGGISTWFRRCGGRRVG